MVAARMNPRTRRPVAAGLAVMAPLVVLLAACGGDDSTSATSATTAASSGASSTAAPDAAGSMPAATAVPAASNACPVEGCKVTIAKVEAAGSELKVSFTANYTPDVARNHFHVFWDEFTPQQVSNDAETKWKVKQGDWVPTADNPFTTTDVVAVKDRGSSTRICVTAGDRDHNVIDPSLFDCRDVTSVLPSSA